ncbi:MAG: redoxin domain-containing protein [Phycisphaeraceae bacterium]|nr:redoxin domain-containing protein [Phycisphaeraceae bacterium]
MIRPCIHAVAAVILGLALAPMSAWSATQSDDPPVRVGPEAIEGRAVGVGRLAVLPETDLLAGGPLTLGVEDRATVLVMTSTTCPLSRKWLPILSTLERGWRPRGVRVVLVDVQGTDTAEELAAFLAAADFQGDAVHDPERAVAKALGASTTTEAFLLDDRGTVRYRGAVDDRLGLGYVRNEPRSTFLVEAVDAVLAGRTAEPAATTSPGCELGLEVGQPRLERTPTWHGSISRLFDVHCVGCHRAGGIGPFPLDVEEEARANAGMIARQVSAGLMPPWFAESVEGEGHSPWSNDRSLAPEEREAIVAWARNGRPSGAPARHPRTAAVERPRPGAAAEWTIGTPDLIIPIPEEIAIPAEGYLDYVNITIDPEFEEDRWVEAWELIPTALDAVHHVLVFIKEPGRRPDRAGFLAAYVPGHRSIDYGDPRVARGRSIAKRIPAGSKLVFQLHYTPNGQVTSDRTRLGLRFAERPPQTEVVTTSASNRRFKIPPGAAAHPVEAFVAIPRDIEILTLMPHMHLRGRSFRYELESPEGVRSTMLDVPRYDFNWQLNYVYREPLIVKRGSRIIASATFDNSEGNPANPDPAATVRWGDQTYDEMMIGYFECLLPTERGEPVAETRSAEGVFSLLDRDRDGELSLEECPPQYRGFFAQIDTDGNERVTLEEMEQGLRRQRGE